MVDTLLLSSASIDRDILSHESSSTEASAPTFPLSSFPTELQLHILRACLISNVPLINFGNLELQREPSSEDTSLGQDQINLSVLATCRLYRTEGWKIFWEENEFMFVHHPDVRGSYSRLTWHLPTYRMLRHISFKHANVGSSLNVVKLITAVLVDSEEFPALKSLNLNIGVVGDGVEELRYDTESPPSFYRFFRQSIPRFKASNLLEEHNSRPSRIFETVRSDDLLLLMIHLTITLLESQSDLDVRSYAETSGQVVQCMLTPCGSYLRVREKIDLHSKDSATLHFAVERVPKGSHSLLNQVGYPRILIE